VRTARSEQTPGVEAGKQPDSFLHQAPAVTLPEEGGTTRGIREKVAGNAVTGTGSASVPMASSPGRSSFGPQLCLTYDSGAGNGLYGFGWSMIRAAPGAMANRDGTPTQHWRETAS
jgi:hypothetical protein